MLPTRSRIYRYLYGPNAGRWLRTVLTAPDGNASRRRDRLSAHGKYTSRNFPRGSDKFLLVGIVLDRFGANASFLCVMQQMASVQAQPQNRNLSKSCGSPIGQRHVPLRISMKLTGIEARSGFQLLLLS
jgi:hypothetical protein